MMSVCPKCRGRKDVAAPIDSPDGAHLAFARCSQCDGTGEVKTVMLWWWWAVGETFRMQRIERGESLRECCCRLGIGVAELCDMENGRADPGRLVDDARQRAQKAPAK